jgi:hypothetical protein
MVSRRGPVLLRSCTRMDPWFAARVCPPCSRRAPTSANGFSGAVNRLSQHLVFVRRNPAGALRVVARRGAKPVSL